MERIGEKAEINFGILPKDLNDEIFHQIVEFYKFSVGGVPRVEMYAEGAADAYVHSPLRYHDDASIVIPTSLSPNSKLVVKKRGQVVTFDFNPNGNIGDLTREAKEARASFRKDIIAYLSLKGVGIAIAETPNSQ